MSFENPYQSPQADLQDTILVNIDPDEPELADLWQRFWGAFVDGLLLGVPAGILAFVAASAGKPDSVGLLIDLLILVYVVFLVVQGMSVSAHAATIGKRFMGTRIVRTNGDPISVPRWLLRQIPLGLAGRIPLIGPFIALGNVLFIFGEERRCLHDQLADTRVIKA